MANEKLMAYIQCLKDEAIDGMDCDKYFAAMTDYTSKETFDTIAIAVMYANMVQAAARLECQLVKATNPDRWQEEIASAVDVYKALDFACTMIRCHLLNLDEQNALLAADMIVRDDATHETK